MCVCVCVCVCVCTRVHVLMIFITSIGGCGFSQAMAIVYGQCHEEIGVFNDTSFVVRKLEEVCGVLGVWLYDQWNTLP